MRKLVLLLLILPFALSVQAQFGYYSSKRVFEVMPQYAQATVEYEQLCKRCEKEIEYNEKELTRLYVAFLDGHREFPEPILRKRQSELQRLVDNSVDFRKQLKTWLVEAKDSLYAPSRQAVDVALERVCQACELDYAIDLDVVAYSYINPTKGADITNMVLEATLYPAIPVANLNSFKEFMRQFRGTAEQSQADSSAVAPASVGSSRDRVYDAVAF